MILKNIDEFLKKSEEHELIKYKKYFISLYKNNELFKILTEYLKLGNNKNIIIILKFFEYFFDVKKSFYKFNKQEIFNSFQLILDTYFKFEFYYENNDFKNYKILKFFSNLYNIFDFDYNQWEIIFKNIITIKIDNYQKLLKILMFLKTINKLLKEKNHKKIDNIFYSYIKSLWMYVDIKISNDYIILYINKYYLYLIMQTNNWDILKNVIFCDQSKQYLINILCYYSNQNNFIVNNNKDLLLWKLKIKIFMYLKEFTLNYEINWICNEDLKIIFPKYFIDFLLFYNDNSGENYKYELKFLNIIKLFLNASLYMLNNYDFFNIFEDNLVNILNIFYKLYKINKEEIDNFHNNPDIYFIDYIELKNEYSVNFYIEEIIIFLIKNIDVFLNVIINKIIDNINLLKYDLLMLDFKLLIRLKELSTNRIDLSNLIFNNLSYKINDIFENYDNILILDVFNYFFHYFDIFKNNYDFYEELYREIFNILYNNIKNNKINGLTIYFLKNIEIIINMDYFTNILNKYLNDNIDFFLKICVNFNNFYILEFLRNITEYYINKFNIKNFQKIIFEKLENLKFEEDILIISEIINIFNSNNFFVKNFFYEKFYNIFLENSLKLIYKNFYLINDIFNTIKPWKINLNIIDFLFNFMNFINNIIFASYDLFKILYEYQSVNRLGINHINQINNILQVIIKNNLIIENFDKFYIYCILIIYKFIDDKWLDLNLIDILIKNIILILKNNEYNECINDFRFNLNIILLKNNYNLEKFNNIDININLDYILKNIYKYDNIFSKINIIYYFYYLLISDMDFNLKIDIFNYIIISLDNLILDINENNDIKHSYNYIKIENNEVIYNIDHLNTKRILEFKEIINKIIINEHEFILKIYNNFYEIINYFNSNYKINILTKVYPYNIYRLKNFYNKNLNSNYRFAKYLI